MKKTLFSVVLISIIFMFSGIGLAEPIEKAIVIENGEEEEQLAKNAIIDEYECLIPVSIIKNYIYSNTILNANNQQMEVEFPLLRFKLEENLLNQKFLKNSSIIMPYKNINGIAYVDAEVAAKIFGFKIEKNKEKLILKINQYNAFNQRTLEKNKENYIKGKIVMAWQPTFDENVDVTKINKLNGLNVISPSWLAVVDENGLIKNKADYRYIKAAQAKGYRVWPLITNSFNPALTHKVLNDEKVRQNIIKQLVIYASLYDFDGINLDFENIYDEDKNALSVFVKEISSVFKMMGLNISIDVTVPSDAPQWSTCYDRKALAETVDYVMLMAYDEHWRTSPVSGSVASIGWVEKGIVNTLKDVPAEKLVLGIPFYMREWQENLIGEKNVKAKTMTMTQAEQIIEDKGIVPMWLDEIGQYYFQYQDENKVYRVWQEEARSITLKTSLVDKYQLAGVAAWRKGFEKTEIWDVISENLKQSDEIKSDSIKESHKEKKKKRKKRHN